MQVSKLDYSKIEPFVAVPDAVLSEGVLYVSPARTLVWVDIYRARVYRKRLDTGVTDVFHAEGSGSIGAVFPILKRGSSSGSDTEVEEFLFAAKEGIAHGQFGGSWKYVVKYSESGLDSERLKRLRSNDGNVCGQDLYIGLINDFDQETTDEGVIFKINLVSKKIDVFWPRISIPNSIYWVGEHMFVTDSMNACIWRTKNGYQEREKFIDVKQYSTSPEGNVPEPDGSCLSSNGELLFVSIWGHSKVQVFSTKDGALVQEILLPKETPRVSCCALVGSDLFVTTGSEHLGTSKIGQQSKGGCLYRLSDVIPGNDESSTRGTIYRDD